MTLIMPEGRIPRLKFRWRHNKLRYRLRSIRLKIDWRYAAREFFSDATDVHRVKVKDANGKTIKMTVGTVKFQPFTIDTSQVLDQDDLLYLRINHLDGETTDDLDS